MFPFFGYKVVLKYPIHSKTDSLIWMYNKMCLLDMTQMDKYFSMLAK